MIVTVFDYGAGNLHSLSKALAGDGRSVRVVADPIAAVDTDVLVLPGVGAFASAAARLEPGRNVMRAAIERGLPCIGICLGMQLLFDSSEEGAGVGLGVIPGRVTRLSAGRVPHIGWNTLEARGGRALDPATPGAPLDHVYYAHSYACRPDEAAVVRAWTRCEHDRFAAIVQRGSAFGVQFHPEKSSRAGVRFLHAHLESLDVHAAFAEQRTFGPGAMPCS